MKEPWRKPETAPPNPTMPLLHAARVRLLRTAKAGGFRRTELSMNRPYKGEPDGADRATIRRTDACARPASGRITSQHARGADRGAHRPTGRDRGGGRS